MILFLLLMEYNSENNYQNITLLMFTLKRYSPII